MTGAPAPLVPADVDLRDFPYMPLDVLRLRDSDLAVIASGDEFRAAVMLWCAAWHQIPAGSLPDDDRMLAKLAGYGRDVESWNVVRNVARYGFVTCDDGRIYHPVIAQKALEAWTIKARRRAQTAAANAARARAKHIQAIDIPRDDTPPRNDQRNVPRDDQRNVHQGKRRENKEESPSLRSGVARAKNTPPPDEPATRAPPENSEIHSLKKRAGIDAQAMPTPVDLAVGTSYGLEPDRTLAEWSAFKDHHIARGSTMADWGAAWRGWLRKRQQFEARAGPATPRRNPDLVAYENLVREANDEHTRRNGSASELARSALAIFEPPAGVAALEGRDRPLGPDVDRRVRRPDR